VSHAQNLFLHSKYTRALIFFFLCFFGQVRKCGVSLLAAVVDVGDPQAVICVAQWLQPVCQGHIWGIYI